MENSEQKFYEDLRFLERIKLKREFNGFSMGIVLAITWILGYAALVAGIVLIVIFGFFKHNQSLQLLGDIMLNAGMFSFFSIQQMVDAKEKNLLKALDSKKQTIIFFAALAVSVAGAVAAIIFIAKARYAWLYWTSTIALASGALMFLIPRIKPTKKEKKGIEAIMREEERFSEWLKKEKNIIRKAR